MTGKSKGHKMLEDYVESKTRPLDAYPAIVGKAIDTIVGESVSPRLKLGVALSELITLASHLRKPIQLFDGTLVPTNAISVILSPSGSSKDKSMNTVRKALRGSYKALEDQRHLLAVEAARKEANINGDNSGNYESYYRKPIPLQSGLGTPEGITSHLAELASKDLGAGSFSCSELASEMQTNPNFTEIVKLMSVGYDLGEIPIKVIKNNESQTLGVKNMPINGLLFGSFDTILYQQDVKNKFKMLFNTQLARRSLFVFTPKTPIRVVAEGIDELYEARNREREQVVRAQQELAELTDNIVKETTHEPMVLEKDAEKLFDVYMELCAVRSDEESGRYPISKLSRKHKQWLAMKLAGAYAILMRCENITEKCYAYAINTVEYLAVDLKDFEIELAKEQHENFVDYCRSVAENGTCVLSTHDLRKHGYITGNGGSKSKIEELAALSRSYDRSGAYTCDENGIVYTELVEAKSVGVSYKMYSDDEGMSSKEFKEYAKTRCSDGYSFEEGMPFGDMGELLEQNAVYSPFEFREGRRGAEYVEGGTGMVILDIDDGNMTDDQMSLLLESYNHYVVRTSDPDNAYKYRVILQLDTELDVSPEVYKVFLKCVAEDIGLVADIVPKSQIFFSYANRTIHANFDGEKYKVKPILDTANSRMQDKAKPAKELPSKSKQALLSDQRETFTYAYEAESGKRSVLIYRALMHAVDLGADEQYIKDLAQSINGYISESMDEERLEKTIVSPILRKM